MKHFRSFAAGITLLALAACATPIKEVRGPLTVSNGFTVQLDRSWSDITPWSPQYRKPVTVLTVDGPALNRLIMSPSVPPGEHLFRAKKKDFKGPTYKAGLSETELVELVADTIAEDGYTQITPDNVRPATLNGAEGVRFEFTALTSSGLIMAGSAAFAERDGALAVVVFVAPREHYFSALAPHVEAVFASLGSARALPEAAAPLASAPGS